MQYIYFTADWCAPCKTVKPKVLESSKAIQVIDVDTNKELAAQYKIRSVPTLLEINNGQVVTTHNGAPAILRFLNA